MFQFKLPDIGEGIAEAEVVAWHVKEGDAVQEDQLVVEVMTDKAVVEISSPRAGRVHRLCAGEGEVLPVGEVLIEIDEGGAGEPEAGEGPAEREAVQEPERPAPEEDGGEKHPPRLPPRPQAHPHAGQREGARPAEAVPAVRELAKRLGVDIEQVQGTGPKGRVMRRDVEAFCRHTEKGGAPSAAPAAPPESPPGGDEPDWTRKPLRLLRRRIAERMALARDHVPHYTYVEEIDMTALEAARGPVSPLAFIARAVVRALPDYPGLNACMDEARNEIIYKGKIHLGIAVATEAGLVVPVIRDAAEQDALALAGAIRDLAARARDRKLQLSDLRESTITITSLGRMGGVMATPIINYPASAIIGVHAIRTLPRYVGGDLAPRQVMNLSVSLDHRIVDGYECAQFVQAVKEILEGADFPELGRGKKPSR